MFSPLSLSRSLADQTASVLGQPYIRQSAALPALCLT
ncbi:hypothetical protein SLEP1_g40034 [Rubroshorea leprosula]|uniref:Uncharacterized protein n=1 Tax=Rubroshorea leprosula TaxID=152421 RepID=A0AAV5L2K6_9ROSI|nr:hypothetical protein SLEP1_g40034 [Rubroshorea leprosula]